LYDKNPDPRTSDWELPSDIFHNNDRIFKWFSMGIVCILAALYIYFW